MPVPLLAAYTLTDTIPMGCKLIALAIQKDDVADVVIAVDTSSSIESSPSTCRRDIIFDLEMVAVDYYSKISFNYLRRPYLIIFNCNPLRLNPNSLAALVTFPPDSSRHLIIICLSTFSM